MIKGKIVDGIVQSYRIPQSWRPNGPKAMELTATVEGAGITIHLDSLRVKGNTNYWCINARVFSFQNFFKNKHKMS